MEAKQRKLKDSPRQSKRATRKRILVFSPDVDVASSLTMLLADQFEVASESNLERLRTRLVDWKPALVLADVHPLPQDIVKLVDILKTKPQGTFVLLLHVFRNWSPSIESAIRSAADFVFYKPVNVEMIAALITDLLNEEQTPEQIKEIHQV